MNLHQAIEWLDCQTSTVFDSEVYDLDVRPALVAVEAGLKHIAIHGEHGEECRRPPQDCAEDILRG